MTANLRCPIFRVSAREIHNVHHKIVFTSFQQCDLLVRIQARFHIRREEFQRVIATAVVNGIQTTQAIYDVTVGAFIEDAKNLTCSDMIDPKVKKTSSIS